jgi:hypothetical protein
MDYNRCRYYSHLLLSLNTAHSVLNCPVVLLKILHPTAVLMIVLFVRLNCLSLKNIIVTLDKEPLSYTMLNCFPIT